MHRKAIARPSKNRPSWAPNRFKNPSKWRPKSSKIAPKRPLGGVLGDVGGVLGPRGVQEPKMVQKPNVGFPNLVPFWGPKSTKIGTKSDPKCDHFLHRFGNRFWERFGANLAPSWPQNAPKMWPSWVQNRSKLEC